MTIYKKILPPLLALGLLPFVPVTATALEWSFGIDSLQLSPGSFSYSYSGTSQLHVNAALTLPIKTIYLETDYPLTAGNFIVPMEKQVLIGHLPDSLIRFDQGITSSDTLRENKTPRHDPACLSNHVFDISRIENGNITYYAVSFLPLIIDSTGRILFNERIILDEFLPVRSCRDDLDLNHIIAPKTAAPLSSAATSLLSGFEFLIVTSADLADEFNLLAEYRRATGISTAVVLIDSLLSRYSGRDNAERLRLALMEFYRNGGRYLLLGGDEAVLPVRYLYYTDADSMPSRHDLMPSDLYFADLTGDWDCDGDNIWGEPHHDLPDMIPELIVGRVPVRNGAEALNFVHKIILYETNPGCGDLAYLERALFFASDEMRDYPAGGQHGAIASAYPPGYQTDTISTVEFPSGADPNPTNPDGSQSIDIVSDGYGIINIIAHGRPDGFVVRSANYHGWPAALILAGPASGSHGSALNIAKNGYASLYYSLACDLGGYELDSLSGPSGNATLIEKLLQADSGGAVAAVANTRWGWIYSSYLLQQAYMRHLFNAAEGNPVEAMYRSWLDYPYLRDLIYGQNYYGDPTLKIYRAIPEKMSLDIEQDETGIIHVAARNGDRPTEPATVIISQSGLVLAQGETDPGGLWQSPPLPTEHDAYTVVVKMDGYVTSMELLPSSISTDITAEPSPLPTETALLPNYPNPFNPRTKIKFSLARKENANISIYNLLGQLVWQWHRDQAESGLHEIDWSGCDQSGRPLASGIYLYRLQAGSMIRTRKMTLLR